MGIDEEEEEDVTAIDGVSERQTTGNNIWYTVSGMRLNGAPTKPGLHFYNGRKVAVKE